MYVYISICSLNSNFLFTGWFKANLDTLTGDYDNYTMCIEKIVVDLFSVHMEISFYSNKSEKNTFF